MIRHLYFDDKGKGGKKGVKGSKWALTFADVSLLDDAPEQVGAAVTVGGLVEGLLDEGVPVAGGRHPGPPVGARGLLGRPQRHEGPAGRLLLHRGSSRRRRRGVPAATAASSAEPLAPDLHREAAGAHLAGRPRLRLRRLTRSSPRIIRCSSVPRGLSLSLCLSLSRSLSLSLSRSLALSLSHPRNARCAWLLAAPLFTSRRH